MTALRDLQAASAALGLKAITLSVDVPLMDHLGGVRPQGERVLSALSVAQAGQHGPSAIISAWFRRLGSTYHQNPGHFCHLLSFQSFSAHAYRALMPVVLLHVVRNARDYLAHMSRGLPEDNTEGEQPSAM